MPERYIIRVVKYFIYLCLLFVIIYGMLLIAGQTTWDTLATVTHRKDIWLLGAVFVILPLLYPFFGFVTRTVRGRMDSDENRSIVLKTTESGGFILVREVHNTMTFRPGAATARVRALFEDKITITLENDKIIISGPRREVVRTEFRLKTFL
ncbi:MAG: hypothetical protein LIO79_07400 [Rikenellaceae bacterium]|nr:hypothetical protein [Rikenellaceae bacterium]